MSEKLVNKIIKIDHHRNGMSGAPFYVVIFESNKRKMAGFVFDESGYIAVTDIEMLSELNIEFAQGNSWRGDNFYPELKLAIDKWENNR